MVMILFNSSIALIFSKVCCNVTLIFSLLLQLGVDINAKDVDGWTPLHAAVHWGQNDACELLAEHGANFSARNKMVTNSSIQFSTINTRRKFFILVYFMEDKNY